MLFKKYNVFKQKKKVIKVIFTIYIIAFLIGTITHIIDIINFGFLGYPNSPMLLNIYWTSLTFFDPLAVLLLIFYPFMGLIFSGVIMISNVGVNMSRALFYYFKEGYPIGYKEICQLLFLIFLFFTIKYCWKKIKEDCIK